MIDSSISPITISTHTTIHNGGHCLQEEKGPELANVVSGFVEETRKTAERRRLALQVLQLVLDLEPVVRVRWRVLHFGDHRPFL